MPCFVITGHLENTRQKSCHGQTEFACLQRQRHMQSSSIQTILSVPELHRLLRKLLRSRTFTADREFHPALKMLRYLIYRIYYSAPTGNCKGVFPLWANYFYIAVGNVTSQSGAPLSRLDESSSKISDKSQAVRLRSRLAGSATNTSPPKVTPRSTI